MNEMGGGDRNMYSVLVGKPKRKRAFGRPRIRLNCILKKQDGRTLIGLMCVKIVTSGNEHWTSIKCGCFLTS